MRVRATVTALVIVAAVVGMPTGCARSEICVSWVDYETPQQAYDDATLVVLGTAEPTGSTRDVFGVPMPVYTIDVAETLKGEAPDALEITPTPLTCMGDASQFPDGVDPLATDDDLVLFLHRDDTGWRPITPYDGVLPAPADGVLPFETTDR